MQSMKNTFVAMMLLCVTYGVYQVMAKPDPALQREHDEFMDALVEDPGSDSQSADIPASLLQDKKESFQADFGAPEQSSQPSPRVLAKSGSTSRDSIPTAQDQQLVDDLNSFVSAGSSTVANTAVDATANRFIPDSAPGGADVRPAAVHAEVPEQPLRETWDQIESLVNRGEFRIALGTLTRYYHDTSIDASERNEMLQWLDALAGKVIYSAEHYLRPTPYIIQPNDTLGSLAERWQVPAQLIYSINRNKIANPDQLQPGVEIKMIGGPFDAEVDTAAGTMTLFLKNLYAGRFDITVGSSVPRQPSEYVVASKAEAGPDGPFWIHLNQGPPIHAVQDPSSVTGIGLSYEQASELFAILSEGSRVRIVR